MSVPPATMEAVMSERICGHARLGREFSPSAGIRHLSVGSYHLHWRGSLPSVRMDVLGARQAAGVFERGFLPLVLTTCGHGCTGEHLIVSYHLLA